MKWFSLPLFLVLLLLVFTSAEFRCPSVAFVIHSNTNNDHVTDFMSATFLHNTKLIVVSGHDTFDAVVNHRRQRRNRGRRYLRVRRVIYNGNPGGDMETFRTGGRKYLGTHRTMAGVLMAMDVYPEVDWVYVLDDDNVVNADAVCATLSRQNSSIPLLLGSVGPRAGGHAPCRDHSSEDGKHFTCCTNTTLPCIANISSPHQYSKFVYDEKADTMVPQKCVYTNKDACCEVVPWPEGIMYGYPFRLRTGADIGMETFSSNVFTLYPYGGSTYALSKAMFNAIGRENWEKYMYILQCTNADISIMTTVLNHGYSIHEFRGFSAPHHVHTVDEQFGAFRSTHQPQEVIDLACLLYPNLRNKTRSPCLDRRPR